MTATLNIRDIGAARKAALEDEARLRGVPVAEVVRACIDEGLARARAAREAEAWRAAARPGLEAETRRRDAEGPLLAEFRRP